MSAAKEQSLCPRFLRFLVKIACRTYITSVLHLPWNVAVVVLVCLRLVSLPVEAQTTTSSVPVESESDQAKGWDLPKGHFQWKALWANASKNEATSMVALTKRMGFNVIITPLDVALIRETHRQGLQFYAWIINLRASSPEVREFCRSHPEFLQKVTPEEQELIKAPRVNPDRENVNGGDWLCPDRGLLAIERGEIENLVRNHEIDGLGLDYVGYRNYHACFCDYSCQRRLAYAQKHPDLSPKEVLRQFSEESLNEYVKQVRECVRAIKPDLKLAIHIYPDFDPDPAYGNRLPVEYSGMTVAWFYKPFWSFDTIMRKTLGYRKEAGSYPAFNRYVPFIGVQPGARVKSVDRLRTEIRIAAKSGTDAIMVAFFDTFLKSPELVDVVVEELCGETVQETKGTGAAPHQP